MDNSRRSEHLRSPCVPRIVAALSLCAVFSGCGTTRFSDTPRTATEQLLLSDAIDNAIDEIDFTAMGGKDVYFDPQYLKGVVDENYIVSALRQQLLASGCILKETRDEATYVVEVRAGAVGTDRQELVFGVPAVNVPNFVPGMPAAVPSSLPEMPLAKKTNQKAVAKISVYAYNRETGLAVWQSGMEPRTSTQRDTWVLGAGPFRRGSLEAQSGFATAALGLDPAGGAENEEHSEGVSLSEEAVFDPELAVATDADDGVPAKAQETDGEVAAPRGIGRLFGIFRRTSHRDASE